MPSIKRFDLSPQVHTQQGADSFWLQFLSSDGEGVIHSPACFSENHELSRSHSRHIGLCRWGMHSRHLLPCWLRSKVAGVAY